MKNICLALKIDLWDLVQIINTILFESASLST